MFGKNIQSTWQIFCYVCEKNIIYIIYKKKILHEQLF
jgi:hypothetical protein